MSREALAAATMLLAGTATAIALAFVLRGFHGGLYVPLLMPAIIGWGVGSAVAAVRVRFRLQPRLPGVVAVAFAALLAYGGYHLLVYLRILDFLAANLATLADRAASDPRLEVQRWFEEQSGREGVLAYLAFVSTGRGAELSPLGLLGRLEPGVFGTLVGAALEAVVAVASGLGFLALRSAGAGLEAEAPRGRRVREVLARTDDETLAAAMQAIDRGDVEAAGRVLRKPVADERWAVALIHDPFSADACTLEILEVSDAGLGKARANRELSSWDGQALQDELRMRR